jgi:type II secretory pathway component GspD/PulD (secretin)
MNFLMIRVAFFFITLALCLNIFPAGFSLAQMDKKTGERIVVCMIQLDHADPEELAAVLEPLLSPVGSIAPYRPTNTLIIKDRASVVDKLSMAIKGKPCRPITDPPEIEAGDVKEQPRID